MCVEAVIKNSRGELWPETCGELAKALGVKVKGLPIKDDYGDLQLSFRTCLCPVDFVKLAKDLNYRMIKHNWTAKHMGEIELIEVVR